MAKKAKKKSAFASDSTRKMILKKKSDAKSDAGKKSGKAKRKDNAKKTKPSGAERKLSNRFDTANATRVYANNFLKAVIARIDYTSPIAELEEGPSKLIVDFIKPEFPIVEQKQKNQRLIYLNPESGVREEKDEGYDWYAYSKKRDKHIFVGPNAAFLSYSKYHGYSDLRKDFISLTQGLRKKYPDLQVKRLGLRYVNHFEFPTENNPTEWDDYFDKKLLANFGIASDKSTIIRSFNAMEFDYGEFRMRFGFGMPNPDHPAPISQKLFVLDFDAYCSFVMELPEVIEAIDLYHRKINASFEEVITQKLRTKMGALDGQ